MKVKDITLEIMQNKLSSMLCKYLPANMSCVLKHVPVIKVCNSISSKTDEYIWWNRITLSTDLICFLVDKTYCQLYWYRDTKNRFFYQRNIKETHLIDVRITDQVSDVAYMHLVSIRHYFYIIFTYYICCHIALIFKYLIF